MKKLNEYGESLPETDEDVIIYEVWRNADRNAGEGPMVPVEAFQDRGDAKEFIKGQKGVQNQVLDWAEGEGRDWVIKPTRVKTMTSCDTLREQLGDDDITISKSDLQALMSFREGTDSYEQARNRILDMIWHDNLQKEDE